MTPYWYVATPYSRRQMRAGVVVDLPASEAHAKAMGTTTTACGLPSTTWTKIFDLRFPVLHGFNCAACLAVVTRVAGGQLT